MSRTHRSSPPARGSSALGSALPSGAAVVPARAGIFPHPVNLHPPAEVVPARAGIFLGIDLTGPERDGRPRPRGDLPPRGADAFARAWSSPPARGSSSVESP
ncbi:hypothetical protein; putative signal peptide [Frankia alni ACN14a]|uniref:Uncharacterized protein n=1 Tax=Frankia alni (strain DSM 45986 / CECT 9034 / ACN14a) TaxID=326424 RepID=Q0RTH3_FRAAA|nr:hypothetical protein; putative signal peptide [Frankia alni ACN14a]